MLFESAWFSESDPPHSNESREVGRVIGRPGSGVDMRLFLQRLEWKTAGDQPISVIEQLIQCAVQDDLIVPGLGIRDLGGNLFVERSRTVPGQSVVPLGLPPQLIQVSNIGEEDGPGCVSGRLGAIQVDFLIRSIVGAQSDDIPFISGDKDQLILAEKAKER